MDKEEVILVDNGNRFKCIKRQGDGHWQCSFKLRSGIEGDFTTPLKWAKTALVQACFKVSKEN